jgi:hypothetical protein
LWRIAGVHTSHWHQFILIGCKRPIPVFQLLLALQESPPLDTCYGAPYADLTSRARITNDDGCHELGIIITIARRAEQAPLTIVNTEESLMVYPTQVPVSGPLSTARACPFLYQKKITLHGLRHTAAMRLLHAGVDTAVIALRLGHKQIETTNVYLHADLVIKQRALARTTPVHIMPGRYRPPDTLMAFLEAL